MAAIIRMMADDDEQFDERETALTAPVLILFTGL